MVEQLKSSSTDPRSEKRMKRSWYMFLLEGVYTSIPKKYEIYTCRFPNGLKLEPKLIPIDSLRLFSN